MLVEIWSKIMEDLEDSHAVSVLTAIYYLKAFNHLEHLSCLKALARKGAGTKLIALIADFLSGRVMTVQVGENKSKLLPVNAGAPQGSVLGSFLFNVGTDDLDQDGEGPTHRAPAPAAVETEAEASTACLLYTSPSPRDS